METKNARPSVGALGQAVETGTPTKMTAASTTNDTTSIGKRQIGLIADRDFGLE